jgi:hypothetical protein
VGIYGRKDAVERVVGRDAVGQFEEPLEPFISGAAEQLHVAEALPAEEHGAHADGENIDEFVRAGAVDARIGQSLKALDDAARAGQAGRRAMAHGVSFPGTGAV